MPMGRHGSLGVDPVYVSIRLLPQTCHCPSSAVVQMAGGTSKYVPLHPNYETMGFELDMAELEAAFTPKTRVLLINTPHNPTGKVFSRKELEDISKLVWIAV